jgi:hypothetical protein
MNAPLKDNHIVQIGTTRGYQKDLSYSDYLSSLGARIRIRINPLEPGIFLFYFSLKFAGLVYLRSKLNVLKRFFNQIVFHYLIHQKTARRLVYSWALEPVVSKCGDKDWDIKARQQRKDSQDRAATTGQPRLEGQDRTATGHDIRNSAA